MRKRVIGKANKKKREEERVRVRTGEWTVKWVAYLVTMDARWTPNKSDRKELKSDRRIPPYLLPHVTHTHTL